MRPATAALTAALLLAGTASRAQDAAGDAAATAENKAAAAEPASAAVQPARPAEPKPRSNLLLDLLDQLVGPRSDLAPAGPAPVPVEPTGSPAASAPAAAGPTASATGAAAAPTVPRDVNAQPAADPAPAGVTGQPPRPADAVPPPAPDVPARPAGPAPADAAAPQPMASATPNLPGKAAPEPAGLAPIAWLPLVLLAAAAAAASGVRLQRTRRIARTRAALALSPRLDLSAGAGSPGRLSFAGPALAAPPLAIRARLDPPGARGG